MKADRFQSICATLLLAGCILAVAGGWGIWHFGLKPAEEKQEQPLSQQPTNDENPPRETAITPSPSPSAILSNQGDKQLIIDSLKSSGTSQPPPQYVLMGSTVVPAPSAVPAPKQKATPAIITSGSASPSPSRSAAASGPERDWSLSDEQRRKIVDALGKNANKSIAIRSLESDAPGLAFATILKHVFEEAGWQVDGVKQVSFAKPPVGLNLVSGSYPAPDGLVAAYGALASVGLKISQQLDTKLTGAQVELIVGTKPAE